MELGVRVGVRLRVGVGAANPHPNPSRHPNQIKKAFGAMVNSHLLTFDNEVKPLTPTPDPNPNFEPQP